MNRRPTCSDLLNATPKIIRIYGLPRPNCTPWITVYQQAFTSQTTFTADAMQVFVFTDKSSFEPLYQTQGNTLSAIEDAAFLDLTTPSEVAVLSSPKTVNLVSAVCSLYLNCSRPVSESKEEKRGQCWEGVVKERGNTRPATVNANVSPPKAS